MYALKMLNFIAIVVVSKFIYRGSTVSNSAKQLKTDPFNDISIDLVSFNFVVWFIVYIRHNASTFFSF